MFSGEYQIVILDEVITAYWLGLLSLKELLDLVELKPQGVELVLG